MTKERGAIELFHAFLLGPLPLALLVLVQDWYVDVNAPGCATGTGTQADPFCDIMDAVAAASDGDTIYIAPGTYFEHLGLGKDLELIGTGGQAVTILDGFGSGRVVSVGASAVVTLTGLTLTNGFVSSLLGAPARGAGLWAGWGSEVVVTSSTVTGNSVVPCNPGPGLVCDAPPAGGGIYASGGGMITLIDSMITANYAGGVGGGIHGSGTLTMANSTLSNNAAGGYAGAYWTGGSMTLSDSVVMENTSLHPVIPFGSIFIEDGALELSDSLVARDGGIVGVNSSVTMTRSIATECYIGVGLSGGSLRLTESSLLDSIGWGVVTPWELFGLGYCDGRTSVTIVNSTISGNGGGIRLGDYSPYYPYSDCSADGAIANSTIAGNVVRGVLVWGTLNYPSSATIDNSILWDNGSDAISLRGTGASATAEYSLIDARRHGGARSGEIGWPGAGNRSADPLFVDPLNGDLRLLPGSPCIDAGNNLAVPAGIWTDLDGKLRFLDDPLTPDTGHPGHLWPIVDMGAYEFGVEHPRKLRRR